MSQRARPTGNLRNPWRYPEFMEYGLAAAGLAQTVIALSIFRELPDRPGLAWTIFVNPQTWSMAGLLLCILHIWGLWEPRSERGTRIRTTAAHLSCAFWCHFVGTTAGVAIFTDTASIATITAPALLAPYASFVVCVRLIKGWQ